MYKRQILKKSSTDPTSDRSAPSTTIKHTTFCDVVTVVDSDDGKVREEPLRSTTEDDDLVDGSPPQAGFFLVPKDTDTSGPSDDVDGFVPDSCSADQKEEVPAEETASKDVSSVGLMSVFSTAATPESSGSAQNTEEPRRKISATKRVNLDDLMTQKDEVLEKTLSRDASSVGLMSVFSTAATPESNSSAQNTEEPRRKISATKRVNLVELMAQMRAEDDGERS